MEGGLLVPSGFKRKRGNDEYVFIDGRALRADEVVRIDLRDTVVPGQEQASPVPGASKAQVADGLGTASQTASPADVAKKGSMSRAFKKMQSEDAFALTKEVESGSISIARTEHLMVEDRRKMRVKYGIFGAALVVLIIFSLCFSSTHVGTFYSPLQVLQSIGAWFSLTFTSIFHNADYVSAYRDVTTSLPCYADCMLQAWLVFKYCACGALLALSGMLYQNTFRNPIAAPSMLGVSNGINFALLILVLQYGYTASQYVDQYYLYSIIGGIVVLLLVMAGGKWISGKGRFNVVNMILMGTIASQLLGILIQYAQATFMDDSTWQAYYYLQNATGATSVWSYVTLIGGGLVALIPVVLFRFKLNLISFDDAEARLLGVNPNKLRLISLGCGSIMILVAQLNAGQVAMASLIIPFIVRAVFGSEFRKQLLGNILTGALVLLVCGIIGTFITFDGMSIGMSSVVSVVAIPLFVWILAIRQRSWE